jgi:hypothetical protein
MNLNVVGVNEAAQILGIEVQRISRWRESGRMPPAVADLAATQVWRVADIERLARDGKWEGDPPEPLEVVGLSEAAELLKTSKRAIARWRTAGAFPPPVLDKRPPGQKWEPGLGLAATPLWQRADVVRFGREHRSRRTG